MTVSDLKRTWVPVALLVLLPALACARTATPSSPDEPVWQPASGWDDSTGLFRTGDVPADYNPRILTLGRSSMLMTARTARSARCKHPFPASGPEVKE